MMKSLFSFTILMFIGHLTLAGSVNKHQIMYGYEISGSVFLVTESPHSTYVIKDNELKIKNLELSSFLDRVVNGKLNVTCLASVKLEKEGHYKEDHFSCVSPSLSAGFDRRNMGGDF